jgi:hypothetical protein
MTPQQAYFKCNGKINKELEKYIIKDLGWSYYYANYNIKGRWLEAEKYIMKNPHYAYYYANDVIKGRWLEAEQYIINDPKYVYRYAIDVIKGKLPENMHNMMLLYADYNAKKYLNFIS